MPPDVLPDALNKPHVLLLAGPFSPDASLLSLAKYENWIALRRHFRNFGEIIETVPVTSHCVLLLPIGERRSEQGIRGLAFEFAQAFQAYEKQLGMDVHVVIGDVCTDVWQLRESYVRAETLLLDGVFHDSPAILEAQSEALDPAAVQRVRDLLHELEQLVYGEQSASAMHPATSLIDQLQQIRSPRLFNEAMLRVEFLLKEHIGQSNLTHPYESVEQARKALMAALQWLEGEQLSQYTYKVRKMIGYAHKHYASEISLSAVAQELDVTPTYAGQLFKKETGKTFTAYATEYRIKKALELLSSAKYRVYEVSEMVGYRSVHHFSKTFKRVTGHTPRDFESHFSGGKRLP